MVTGLKIIFNDDNIEKIKSGEPLWVDVTFIDPPLADIKITYDPTAESAFGEDKE